MKARRRPRRSDLFRRERHSDAHDWTEWVAAGRSPDPDDPIDALLGTSTKKPVEERECLICGERQRRWR